MSRSDGVRAAASWDTHRSPATSPAGSRGSIDCRIRRRARMADTRDIIRIRPVRSNRGAPPMLDYLRIVIDARRARLDDRGASAVEYGLLITGIAALIIVVVFAFGGVLNTIFDDTCASVANKGASGGTCA